jgi:hypothetical protein
MRIAYYYNPEGKVESICLSAENQAEDFQIKGVLRDLNSESIKVDFVNHTGHWTCVLELK